MTRRLLILALVLVLAFVAQWGVAAFAPRAKVQHSDQPDWELILALIPRDWSPVPIDSLLSGETRLIEPRGKSDRKIHWIHVRDTEAMTMSMAVVRDQRRSAFVSTVIFDIAHGTGPRENSPPNVRSDGSWIFVHFSGWPLRSHFSTGRMFLRTRVTESRNTLEIWSGKKSVPIGILWPGAIANTLTYALTLLALGFGFTSLKRWNRMRRGRCAACGYQLAESIDVCSECGYSLPARR